MVNEDQILGYDEISFGYLLQKFRRNFLTPSALYCKKSLTIKLAPAGCGEECNVVVELIFFVFKFSVYIEN